MYLRGKRCIGVIMSHDSREWQGDVGNCDDDFGGTLVVFAVAICHVVDPLPVFFSDEALVLAGIPVVASRVVTVAAVHASYHPPVTFDLSTWRIY